MFKQIGKGTPSPASAFDARMTALKCVSSARNVTVFSCKQMRGRERLHIEEQCVCHCPDSSAMCSSEWYWLRHQASSLISSAILQQYRGREEQRKTKELDSFCDMQKSSLNFDQVNLDNLFIGCTGLSRIF